MTITRMSRSAKKWKEKQFIVMHYSIAWTIHSLISQKSVTIFRLSNQTASNLKSLTNLNILKEDLVFVVFDLLLIRWNRTEHWWLTWAWIFFYTKKTSKTYSSVHASSMANSFMPCTNTLFTAIAANWSRKWCWSKSNITSIKRYTTEFKFH